MAGRARKLRTPAAAAAPAADGPVPAALPAVAEPGPRDLVCESMHRFPWPADPRQRYNPYTTPYLAVVNARGPWHCWRHDTANPPFIPLYLDLFAKGFWRSASDGQRVFALSVWVHAARDDDWGIVWGDPARLMHEWGLDPVRMIDHLDWMIVNGLACYLTHAEAAAARSWRGHRGRTREGEGGSKRGEEQGQASSSKQEQEQARQGQEQEPAGSQSAGSARALSGSQFPGGVGGKGQEQEQARASKSQGQGQGQGQASTASVEQVPQPSEAGKLPESDQGSGTGLTPPPAGRGDTAASGRTPSVSEAVTIGQVLTAKQLAWGNPLAVDFARHMVSAIRGRVCNEDLSGADDRLLMDLGPWVYFWVEHVQNTLSAGDFGAFRDRCVADIARKRKCRGVKNLGGLARSEIVPGVLRSMARGS